MYVGYGDFFSDLMKGAQTVQKGAQTVSGATAQAQDIYKQAERTVQTVVSGGQAPAAQPRPSARGAFATTRAASAIHRSATSAAEARARYDAAMAAQEKRPSSTQASLTDDKTSGDAAARKKKLVLYAGAAAAVALLGGLAWYLTSQPGVSE